MPGRLKAGAFMNVGIIGYGSMGRMLLEKFAASGIAPDKLLFFQFIC